MIKTSSDLAWKSLVILGHLWKSLVIFKLSENVRKLLCGHLTTFGEALKIFNKLSGWKSSENHPNITAVDIN